MPDIQDQKQPESTPSRLERAGAQPGCLVGLLFLVSASTYLFMVELQAEVSPTLFYLVMAVALPYCLALIYGLWRLRPWAWWMSVFAIGLAAGFSLVQFAFELQLVILLRFLVIAVVLVWLLANRHVYSVGPE